MALSSETAIRAYAHPVRMEILRLLGREEMTISQVAAALNTIPANLSRHFKRLLEAGLIGLVRTRDTGRNLEKYYAAAARAFRVERGGSAEDRAGTALAILRDGMDEALARGAPALRDTLACLASLRLSPRKKASLVARIAKLVDEYKEAFDEKGEGLMLSVAVYPSESSNPPDTRVEL